MGAIGRTLRIGIGANAPRTRHSRLQSHSSTTADGRARFLRIETLESRHLLSISVPLGLRAFAPPEPSAGSHATVVAVDAVAASAARQLAPAVDVPAPLAPSLGTSFDTANFDTNSTHTGSVFVPPDPIGAAGPNHVVNVINVSIEWHTKTGITQNSQSLLSFFAPLSPVNFTFDPKVIYDQYADRFVVVTLERQFVSSGDPTDSSRILLAVSDDSDPNGSWHFHSINSKLNIGGLDRWADYPGFAVDEDAVYVTANMFGFGGGPFVGTRLWIVHKGAGSGGFYDGGAATVSLHDPVAEDVTASAIALTTQPAHVFGAPAGFGTFLVQHSGLSDGFNEFVSVIRLDDPLGAGAGPTFTNQFINVGNIDNQAALPDAPQSGSTIDIDVNDRRALHAVWRNNSLYLTATILPNAGPDLNQTTAHWFEIDTTLLGSLSLADQGNVGGEDIAVGTYTFFPSIAVDGSDNVAIGFAASAPTIFPGAYYTGREPTDPAGTVQASQVLRAGVDFYERVSTSSGRNRWGDYTGISVDPLTDATFWVYNQYAMQRGTPTAGSLVGDGRWATAFGSFSFSTTVTGRHLFYDNSSFDSSTPGVNAADSSAIATDKIAYLPGTGTITPASMSSYSRGIQGVFVDLTGAHGTLGLADFGFQVSNQGSGPAGANNSPSTWSAAPAPTAFTVLSDTPAVGTDRVEFIWADNAIDNRYLEVRTFGDDAAGAGNTNTGLAATDIFYFGNIVGDTFNDAAPTVFLTTATDETAIQTQIISAASITSIHDMDRNGVHLASDRIVTRGNTIFALNKINISNPPAAPIPAGEDGAGSAIASALATADVSLDDSTELTAVVDLPAVARPLASAAARSFWRQLGDSGDARAAILLGSLDDAADAPALDVLAAGRDAPNAIRFPWAFG